jgi:hypothetical protein
MYLPVISGGAQQRANAVPDHARQDQREELLP